MARYANDTISYDYDELGRGERADSSTASPRRRPTTRWRSTREVSDPIGTFTYGYVGYDGAPLARHVPERPDLHYAYFPNSGDHRLQDIHHQFSGGTTLSRFTYVYDAGGDIKTWTQQADTSPAKAYDLGYDPADQLTAATYRTTDPTPAVLKRYRLRYDPAGNRTTEQIDDGAMAASLQQHEPASQPAGRGSARLQGDRERGRDGHGPGQAGAGHVGQPLPGSAQRPLRNQHGGEVGHRSRAATFERTPTRSAFWCVQSIQLRRQRRPDGRWLEGLRVGR